MKKLLALLLLFLPLSGYSQEVRTTYSSNGKYFLQSISYEDYENKELGITKVFTKDSVEIYSINQFFETNIKRHIILSNDGKSVCYIISKEWDKNYKDQRGILLFRNGELIKEYKISDLIFCDDNITECNLTFWKAVESVNNNDGRNFTFKPNTSNFEKFLCDSNTFIKNDSVLIFTNVDSAIVMDIQTGFFTKEPFSNYSRNQLLEFYSLPNYLYKNLGDKPCWDFPKLTNGMSVEKAIAKGLNMKIFPEESRNSWKYYEYSLSLKCLIDKSGKAEIIEIEAHDSIPHNKIDSLFSSFRFKTECLLKYADKTAFNLIGFGLMNSSKKVSIEEKRIQQKKDREEYQERLILDTINGFYIPKNLEECLIQLDKLLKQKDKIEMKALAGRENMIKYHHGLGTYLRNNWGLWRGSRLQKYFSERGVKHPDSMSGIILNYYHDWLKGKNETWKD